MSTIFIIHIPKAAGTTLRIIMERQYARDEVFKIDNDIPAYREQLAFMPSSQQREYKVVFGHMCWGWHNCFVDDIDHHYVTILRDPVERVLSLYAYCKLPGHYLHSYAKDMTLLQFLRSGVTRTCDNGMVRQLCGCDAFLRAPYFDMALPFEGITDEHLATAKHNLDECAIVGLSEHFGESMSRMRRRFGWRIPPYKNRNVTKWPRPNRSSLGPHGTKLMERYTGLDHELYDHAVEIFKRG